MSNTDKKYQIFVSSTYKDLIVARAEVIKVILDIYHIPIGMEMFNADNDDQWEVIKNTIDGSDYYIIIVGHRYGSTKGNISYTEKEFDYAKKKNIPVLAFIKNENAATTPDERDNKPELKVKLDKFRNKVKKSRMVDFWETEHQLGQQVLASLVKIMNKTPRTGWVRADQATSSEVSEQLAALIKDNRELRDELEQLRINVKSKKPSFKLLLNNKDKPSFKFNEDVVLPSSYRREHIFIQQIYVPELNNTSNNLSNQSLIKNYNDIIIENEPIVSKYNSALELFLRKLFPLDFKLTLENIGTSIANKIYFSITFPSEMFIIDRVYSNDLWIPQWPTEIPKNPLYNGEYVRLKDHLLIIIESKKRSAYNMLDFYNIENNTVSIEIDNLLHTRNLVSKSIYATPLKKGSYKAEVKYICEEFESFEYQVLPITII